jgi:hypothetical protein
MIDLPKSKLSDVPAYRPVLDLVSDVLISSDDLAAHWGYSESHVANLRRDTSRGVPWIKLPTGGIRYRLSEILAAEIAGTTGAITLDRVALAVAACGSVPPEHRAAIVAHLREALGPRK